MSNTETLPIQTKTPLNKKQLFADLVAFCSIVSSYFLISITLHFNVFQTQLGFALNTHSTIIVLYLSYTALVVVFKLLAIVLTLVKKPQGENSLGSWINSELNFSLFIVLFVSSLYILLNVMVRPFTVEQFCHIALWLWLSEVLRIFGGLLGRLTGITSFNYLGRSIQIILLVGGVLQLWELGVFGMF